MQQVPHRLNAQRLQGASFNPERLRSFRVLRIVQDDLSGPEIAALLSEHVRSMFAISPVDSAHTLSLDALRSPQITMWSAWQGAELLACGALQELDELSGEIKSMCTASAHRGHGYGSAILQHIIAVARERHYCKLYLETGSSPEFKPAHALYRKAGFTYCGPFANYREDPFSRFMVLQLQTAP
tara:strand:- start:51868 stop:52419 length:552 start_codon:yes stop_codon:yes gene_type:complete